MALIKCSECGKEISNKAHTCPNCGHPRTSIFGSLILCIAITLLLSFLVVFSASLSPTIAAMILMFIALLTVVMIIIFLARRI